MNPIIQALFNRKSVRAYLDRPIMPADRDLIIDAAIPAPTAGNQTLYTILDITDQALKDKLAVSCDNQPFIAKAPLVLIFLADCRKWLDCYRFANATPREPASGDFLLAASDALIAAQNAVVVASALGIGSCYIGDILENCAYFGSCCSWTASSFRPPCWSSATPLSSRRDTPNRSASTVAL